MTVDYTPFSNTTTSTRKACFSESEADLLRLFSCLGICMSAVGVLVLAEKGVLDDHQAKGDEKDE
jgi:hypothetical protein